MTNFQSEQAFDKGAYEFRWAKQLAKRGLTREGYEQWRTYRSVDRLAVNLQAVFVHWGWLNGKSVVLGEFRLTDVKVAIDGVTYTLEDNYGGVYPVTHTPSELGNTKVFVWVPHFNEFRHVPEDWEDAKEPGYLRVGICVWQPSNAKKVRIANHTYITTRRVFERDWAFKSLALN